MGGSGSMMAKALGQQSAPAPTTPMPGYGSNYQAPQATPYAPRQQPGQVSPFVQTQRAQMMQQQMPQQIRGIGQPQSGLQSMLSRIMAQHSPQQFGQQGMTLPQGYLQQGMPPPPQGMMPPQGYGQQMGMPSYGQHMGPQGYRPDMSQIQQNLSRVSPSVQKQNQDAQAAQTALDAANAQQEQNAPSNNYGGGGD